MDAKTLLITGFAPFGDEDRNPSWEAVDALPERIGQWTLSKLLLPVEYGRAAAIVKERADALRPGAVLSVGLAAGRTEVTPEAVGLNMRDASIADNAGVLCAGEPVDPSGPAAIFSTLPVRAMTEAIRAQGVPARLSYTAGHYVCNDVLYSLLLHFAGTATRAAFIHVPPARTLPLSDSIRALTAAIEAI